jgi:hypothetical protein
MQDLKVIAEKLLQNDANLLELAEADDEKVAVIRDGKTTL